MKVNVKWNKEVLKDIEVDMEQPPEVFKLQLYSLTGVPPERQKVMGKGGLLKDEEWGKVTFKAGMTVIMMGTADKPPETSSEPIQFLEDLPEEEQEAEATKEYGAGLVNLGNTCYMNACLQCLFSVSELKDTLASMSQSGNALAVQGDVLFKQMARGGTFTPYAFLNALRSAAPQFDQLGTSMGETGKRIHAQQDAEECWTAILTSWRNALSKDGNDPIRNLFGIRMSTTLKCTETEETLTQSTDVFSIKCNITVEINLLHEGIKLALVEDREKNSEQLGRSAVWGGKAEVAHLPPYLTVQVMRFFYKAATQNRAKIKRKVAFPLQLDMFEYCTEELRAELKGPRWAFKTAEDIKQGIAQKAKSDSAAGTDADGDTKMAADVEVTDYTGRMTGRFDLIAVLTHKGRTLDSGHYVGWVKQKGDNMWVQFDDDRLIQRKDEDIMALGDGGDWHTAYMMLYRAQVVPAAPDPATTST